MNKFYKGKPAKLVAVHHFNGGGAVRRSENVEQAIAERKYRDTVRDVVDAKSAPAKTADDMRINDALADRASRRRDAEYTNRNKSSARTGYDYSYQAQDKEPKTTASQRLKNSPVNIGEDD